MKPVVAVVQMVSGPEVSLNLDRAADLIARAAAIGAKLIVLPESFSVFGNPAALKKMARREADESFVSQWLATQARQHRCILVGGTVAIASADGRAWAACQVFDEHGELLGRYDKIHLFDARVGDGTGRYRESEDYRPGAKPVVVDTSLGKLGLGICYDLRFPAQFQYLREQGAELIAVPSAFTRRTGLAHWLPLLRARSIETQCMLLGANQGGEHSAARKTSGGSAIVDCWGEVRAETGFGNALVYCAWDRELQRRIRADMLIVDHARFRVVPPS